MHTYTLATLFVPSVKEELTTIIMAINYITNYLFYYMVVLYSSFFVETKQHSQDKFLISE